MLRPYGVNYRWRDLLEDRGRRRLLNNLAGKTLNLSLTRDTAVLLALLTITCLTGIVSGSYPALFLSSFRPAVVLKGAASSGSSKPRLRKTLVVVQFSIAIVLLIGTAAVYKQLNHIRNVDLGYNRHHVVTMAMNQVIRSKYQAFKEEILRDAAVINVTASTSRPTWVGNINPVYWEGRNPGQYETMNFEKSVSGSWLQRWNYEHQGQPTISTLVSVQIPYDEPGAKTDIVMTLIITKNIGKGVGYFNTYAETTTGFTTAGLDYGVMAGYKLGSSDILVGNREKV